jgi:hypothetical protein
MKASSAEPQAKNKLTNNIPYSRIITGQLIGVPASIESSPYNTLPLDTLYYLPSMWPFPFRDSK